MWYQNRDTLDKISRAGVYSYESEYGNPIVRMNGNFWLECEKDDDAFTPPALKTGNWEAWNAVAIMNELKEPSLFVDAGANVGYYTVMAAMANVPVYSYEPHPEVFKLIERSLWLNNINVHNDHVIVNNFGLGRETGKLVLHEVENHTGANSFAGSGDGIEVLVCTLDNSLGQPYSSDRHHVIKADVEGFEREVWDGAKQLNENCDTVWFVEWVPVRHGADYNREWLNEVIQTHDLQMVNYDGSLRPVGVEEALKVEFETIVFRKRA
ncbi:methyltransferase [Rhodococcus phage NiceHouse]|nr:methyltransferase [Rhodococcus phage NiceHouse]